MRSAPSVTPGFSASPWFRRHRRGLGWATAWVPIVVIAFLLIGFGDFTLVSFSGGGPASGGPCSPYAPGYCPFVLIGTESLPSGANVTVHWTAHPAGAVQFFMAEPNQPLRNTGLCNEIGASGTCHLIASGGEYRFFAYGAGWGDVPQSVTFTGSYYTSLL